MEGNLIPDTDNTDDTGEPGPAEFYYGTKNQRQRQPMKLEQDPSVLLPINILRTYVHNGTARMPVCGWVDQVDESRESRVESRESRTCRATTEPPIQCIVTGGLVLAASACPGAWSKRLVGAHSTSHY
jgi:hypothetical protein